MLIFTVSEYLNELFENRSLAAFTALSELGRVMVMAVHMAVMFVVAVLGAEDGGAEGAGEVVDMVFPIKSCDVGPAQGSAASMTE